MNTTKHWTRLVLILLFCLNVQAQQEGQPGKRVLFIGDSITDGGWGRSGGNMLPSEKRNQKDQNHLLGHSFVFLCAAHFQSEYPEADYVFLNRGISGNTLKDLKERWQKDATELHPDVISLLVGTNDVDKWLNDHAGMDFDIKAWGQDYRHLLSEALEQNPQLKLVLCTPFVGKAGKIGQQPTFNLREKYISACAAEVRIIAKEFDAVLIDYHQLFAELAKHQPRTDYWLWDGIHPTPAGHQRMADEWIKKGQAILYP